MAFTTAAKTIIQNNTSSAWTLATSTSASPLIDVTTTSGSEEVSIGIAGGDVIIGDVGTASNLVFEESSTIHGQGANTLTFGVAGDKINVAVDLGVGTSTPADKLHVVGDIRVGTGTTGCVKDADGTVIAGTCSSDERLKTDIEDVQDVLAGFNELRIIQYKWNDLAKDEFRYGTEALQLGALAQNVEQIFPELVVVDDKGFKQVNYTGLNLYGLQAIKELGLRMDDLLSSDTTTQSESEDSGIIAIILNWFEKFGITINDTIAKFKNLAAATLTVGSKEKPNGITLYDEETGEAYCVKIRGGEMVSEKGTCEELQKQESEAEKPELLLIGNNPAMIAVGSGYSDLGAKAFIGKDADKKELSVYVFVDGIKVDSPEINTASSSVQYIDYIAVNKDAFATSTRIILIGDKAEELGASSIEELITERESVDWKAMLEQIPTYGQSGAENDITQDTASENSSENDNVVVNDETENLEDTENTSEDTDNMSDDSEGASSGAATSTDNSVGDTEVLNPDSDAGVETDSSDELYENDVDTNDIDDLANTNDEGLSDEPVISEDSGDSTANTETYTSETATSTATSSADDINNSTNTEDGEI
jgi:hypothetical protein